MKIAQYRGKTLVSKCIKFVTRSDYSHSAFVFDENTEAAASSILEQVRDIPGLRYTYQGAVVEAWLPEVRNTPNLSFNHEPHTIIDVFNLCHPVTKQAWPLTMEEEKTLLLWLGGEIGTRYNWRDVVRFVTRHKGNIDNTWFCSELVFEGLQVVDRQLLERTAAWEVPPGWIQRSPYLDYYKTVTDSRELCSR